MIEVDRIMVDDIGIGLEQMMENAGRGLARLVHELAPHGDRYRVVVLAGRGGNGGGALVAARRLAGWDISVEVYVTHPAAEYHGVPAHQRVTLDRMGVTIHDQGMPSGDGSLLIIIDGLVGYSLAGTPRGRSAELIDWAVSIDAPIVSLDVPSGLDTATGEVRGAVIFADATLTLALPKPGLVNTAAAPYVGDLYVADIGVPASLYRQAFGIDIGGLFDRSDVMRIV